MKIKVEKEDIQTADPIKNAVLRQHGLECVVDRKFLQVKGNERFPRRLPVSAEGFMYKLHVGEVLEPFEFEV